jgi:capsular polysaccharide biosynthesis protein
MIVMQPPLPVLEYGTSQPTEPKVLAKRLGRQALFALIGVCCGLAVGWLLAPTPLYRASASLIITSIPSGIPLPPGTRALNPSEIPATSQNICDTLNAPAFRQRVVNSLKIADPSHPAPTLNELPKILKVNTINQTTLFEVQATHTDPAKAKQIADLAAIEADKQFRGTAPSVMVLSMSSLPSRAINDPVRFMMVIGIAGGVVVPVAVWLIRRRTRSWI